MAYLVGQVDPSGNRLYSSDALTPLASYIEQKEAFGAAATFIPNAALISNINVQGEFLSSAPWTVYDRIGTTTQTIANSAPGVSGFDLHAQALLAAYLQSDLTAPSGQALNEVTATVPQLLGMIFDSKLYSFRADDVSNRNFLDHLVRHETGGIGGIPAGGDGMLTHFASDLNKLGTNIAGLNKAAQDAIIAQGIEWYYWQGTDYAGKEFFTQTGALLQYTSAIGDGLQGAQNKAAAYAKLWLDPKAAAHGAYGVGTTYEQWNVNTGTSAVTATARDVDKSQIFVGNFAAETFIGGNKNDVMLADDGDDTLDGGKGDDKLYGGSGTDTYTFSSSDLVGWGTDTIGDTDGIIKIDADTLSGGKSISPRLGRAWISDDKKYQFQFKPNALTPNGTAADSNGTLVIHRTGRLADKEAIVLNNWSQGKFGITLTTDAALPVSPAQVRVVNGDTVPLNTSTNADTGEVTYIGSATVAAPGNSDAITAYNTSCSIKRVEVYGLDGNDALIGDASQNLIDGGAGDDLIAGGLGLNTLIGGEGNDIILTHFTPGIVGRRGPEDSWAAPTEANAILAQGATWGVYKDAQGVMHVSTNNTRYDPQAQAGTPEASKATEVDYFLYPLLTNPLNAIEQSWVTETDAGAGNDIVLGGIATDIIDLGEGDDVAFGNLGHDDIRGGAGADRIYGDSGKFGIGSSLAYYPVGDDFLDGGAGQDILVGGLGADILYGGNEDDLLFGDYVTLDVAQTTADDWLLGIEPPADASILYYDYADYLDGGAGADNLIAGGGNDTLLGGIGADILQGEQGDDILDGGADNDMLYGGAGADQMEGGAGDDVLMAGSGDDSLFGGAGNDTLYADSGRDLLDGGEDDDTYVIASGQGVKVIRDSGGVDTLRLASWFGLDGFRLGLGSLKITSPEGDEIHIEGFDPEDPYGSGAIEYFELASGQIISYSELLAALPMFIDGTEGDDVLLGTALDDTLYGSAGNDTIDGRAGNDWIDGGTGADQMTGGTGDDNYVIDQAGDQVVELEGGGRDTVTVSFDYTLNVAHVESLVLAGAAITGIGNDLDNGLYGNELANTLMGLGGDDTLAGGEGDDLLNGGEGADTLLSTGSILDIDATTGAGDQVLTGNAGRNRLDGGTGADRMLGGSGDDTYVVDDVLDQVIENPGEGFDTVRTALNDFTLSAELEGLVLEGAALNGFGNSANNVLIGNAQNNILEGFTGNDTLAGWRGNDELRGGAGNDTYAFSRGDGVDAVIDSEGSGRLHFSGDVSMSDLVFSSVGDDLVIDVLDAGVSNGDRVILKNWMISPERVDSLSFCGNVSIPLDESVLNHAPEALADHDEVAEDITVAVSGNVLGNDSDPDQGQILTVKNPGTFAGLYGALTLTKDGSYQYVLDSARTDIQALGVGETRAESFSYIVTDDAATKPLTANSTLTITILGANDVPIVQADTAAVVEDGPVEAMGNALVNDSDVDVGDQLRVTDTGTRIGQYGQLVLTSDGEYRYTLNNADMRVQSLAAGQKVTEAFSYTAQDDSAEPGSASGQIVVTVTGVNDAPVLNLPLADRVVEAGQAISFVLPLSTFSDIDQGDLLTYAAQVVDASGNVQALPSWLSFDAATRTFHGTAAGATDLDIRVIATDLSGATAFDEFNLQATVSGNCGKGNEGVGNGEDPPPPGHDTNWNDGPGTSPGHPGRRGGGKKPSTSTDPGALASADDQAIGGYEDGWDTIIFTINYVLPAHMQALVLDGSGAINATGNALDNWLVGNSGSNVLNAGSGSGTDILQGGQGSDQLTDGAGSNLLDGGAGVDVLTDGEGASWLFGGKGNDTINLGQDSDLLGFNRGDGADVVNPGQEALANDVVSLGKGIRYADLRLAKKGNDLVLDVGAGDSITFSKWYVGSVNKGVGKLQIVTVEGDYDATSTDKTRDQQVEVFDFAKLVQKFDAARAASAINASGWAMMNSLLDAHLQGSNTAALGGDLSYQYATTGSLAGIGLGAAQSSLAAGTDWQNLKNRSQLEQGSVQLM